MGSMQQGRRNIRRALHKSEHPAENDERQNHLHRSRLLARQGKHLFQRRQHHLYRLERESHRRRAENQDRKMERARRTDSHTRRLRTVLREEKRDLRKTMGGLQRGQPSCLRRLRRGINVLIRSRKSSGKLLQPLPQQQRQGNIPRQRMDDRTGTALHKEAPATDSHHLHHTRHKHRTKHCRKQQTALRLPLRLQRRPDGSRTKHAEQTLH